MLLHRDGGALRRAEEVQMVAEVDAAGRPGVLAELVDVDNVRSPERVLQSPLSNACAGPASDSPEAIVAAIVTIRCLRRISSS